MTPANEGPGTSTRYTAVSYLQDAVPATGGTTIRDAVIKQITYGTGASGSALSGTVDFLYKGVTAFSAGGIQFVTAYGSNEGGCVLPSGQPATTLRCDDPVDYTGGAIAQTTTTNYDGNQGQVPISTVDANAQTTSIAYSYDASGNKTVQAKAPGEPGSYTTQAQIISTCTDSSVLPCVHQESSSVQYSSAISRTFYDQLGRAVETQTPFADGSHTIVSFTLYNDRLHTVLSSQPFTLSSQTAWVDPNSYTSTPGTIVTLDALGRTISVLDAANKTTRSAYGLGTANGDSAIYATSTGTDANGHVAVSFTDALGRTRYSQTDNGQSRWNAHPCQADRDAVQCAQPAHLDHGERPVPQIGPADHQREHHRAVRRSGP